MGKTRQINIKNRTYYFYSHQIKLKDFDASLLRIGKKVTRRLTFTTLVMWLLKKIANCNNVNSVNPLYLMINKMIRHFKDKNGNKYLVLDDVDENKKVLKRYEEVWECVKKEIETINVSKKIEYGKDF